jgi:hypothetical protein
MCVQFQNARAIIARLFAMGGIDTQLPIGLSKRPGLLKAAVESIVSSFRTHVGTGLQTARSFKIPDQKDQASDIAGFELVTWLVIKRP